MTALADDVVRKPPPPRRIGGYIAVGLELAILGTFTVQHSVLGVSLCLGYGWFSATWSLIAWHMMTPEQKRLAREQAHEQER